MPHYELDEITRNCIEACTGCHNVCVETLSYCISQGGTHVKPDHLRIMMDCATVCHTAADMMLGKSHFDNEVCLVCANICDQCAESCASFTTDETMQVCAEACRKCADTCRAMVAQHRRAA